ACRDGAHVRQERPGLRARDLERPLLLQLDFHQRAAPRAWSCCHTRNAVCGIVICVTPRCAKASTTAAVNVGIDPTCGDSARPWAPSGWWGDGVTVKSVSQCGASTAVGRK